MSSAIILLSRCYVPVSLSDKTWCVSTANLPKEWICSSLPLISSTLYSLLCAAGWWGGGRGVGTGQKSLAGPDDFCSGWSRDKSGTGSSLCSCLCIWSCPSEIPVLDVVPLTQWWLKPVIFLSSYTSCCLSSAVVQHHQAVTKHEGWGGTSTLPPPPPPGLHWIRKPSYHLEFQRFSSYNPRADLSYIVQTVITTMIRYSFNPFVQYNKSN